MKLSKQQTDAISAIQNWMHSSDPVFRLFGYAGTGKTTLAKHVATGCTLFCAFTGKAAHVLREKGCNACTIHQLIYLPKERCKQRLKKLTNELKTLPDDAAFTDRRMQLEREIRVETKRVKSPAWDLNQDSEIRRADLIVVDECSMIDERMARDLMSYGTKILVLGDPAQLPPVKGAGFFIDAEPDFMLTQIHRQAEENPIIQLATKLRNQQMPRPDGDMVVPWKSIDPMEAVKFDQILVGRNKTRKATNARIRELLGRKGRVPVAGDKLVCLRNDHDVGLLNGALWYAEEVVDTRDGFLDMSIQSDGGEYAVVQAHRGIFTELDDDAVPWYVRKEAQEFDYGYVLTCHKAQGSEWENVLVFDESECFGYNRFKWLYTAVTRASQNLVLAVKE